MGPWRVTRRGGERWGRAAADMETAEERRGGLLSLERQRQVVLEPGPFGRLVGRREEAEVDDGPDAMIAEPGPSGLVPGRTGAREPLLPDHPVARNGRRRLPSGSTRDDSSREPF